MKLIIYLKKIHLILFMITIICANHIHSMNNNNTTEICKLAKTNENDEIIIWNHLKTDLTLEWPYMRGKLSTGINGNSGRRLIKSAQDSITPLTITIPDYNAKNITLNLKSDQTTIAISQRNNKTFIHDNRTKEILAEVENTFYEMTIENQSYGNYSLKNSQKKTKYYLEMEKTNTFLLWQPEIDYQYLEFTGCKPSIVKLSLPKDKQKTHFIIRKENGLYINIEDDNHTIIAQLKMILSGD